MSRRRRFWRKLRSLYLWHRYLGVAAALLLLLLATTGLLLNHAVSLGLDHRRVETAWLLDLYGIAPPVDVSGYRTSRHWLVRLDESLYLDRQPVADGVQQFGGVAENHRLLALAIDGALWLFDESGREVERLDTLSGLPDEVEHLGMGRNGEVIITAGAENFIATTADLLEWQTTGTMPDSLPPTTIPEPLLSSVIADYRARQLHWERLLQELHSGRLVGGYGPLLMDLTALVLIFSTLSGLTIVTIRFRQRRKLSR